MAMAHRVLFRDNGIAPIPQEASNVEDNVFFNLLNVSF
jgi:hypothetical protein